MSHFFQFMPDSRPARVVVPGCDGRTARVYVNGAGPAFSSCLVCSVTDAAGEPVAEVGLPVDAVLAALKQGGCL